MANYSQYNRGKGLKNVLKCTYYYRLGYNDKKYQSKYPKLVPKEDKKESKKETTLYTNSEDKTTEDIEMALSTTTREPATSRWILDSGATRHICAYKGLFNSLKPCAISLNWGKASQIRVNWLGSVKV